MIEMQPTEGPQQGEIPMFIETLQATADRSLTTYQADAQALAAARLATAVRSDLFWDTTYDKYRRPAVALFRLHFDAQGACVGHDPNLAVVVTLPKRYRDENPGGGWLLNVRPAPGSGEYQGAVSYHGSRAAAQAAAESAVTA
jgi:hypothetical protein